LETCQIYFQQFPKFFAGITITYRRNPGKPGFRRYNRVLKR
jgi:hypothetical protein